MINFSFVYFIYNYLIISISYLFYKIFILFNKKSFDRENKWRDLLYSVPEKNKLRILIHSASMGEFEQAKPVIEEIRKIYNDCEIIASFFSPSGYDNQKNYQYINNALYLPIDTESNAKEFVDILKPDIAIFVRYDLWLNTLLALNKANCKNFLICAAKPSENWFSSKKLAKSYFMHSYNQFQHIFTVDAIQTKYLQSINVTSPITTLSDTRSDRILYLVNIAQSQKIITDELLNNSVNLVAGSSWQKDEELISNAVNIINKNEFKIRVIYTPHLPTLNNIERIKSYHKNTILLSDLLNKIENNSPFLEQEIANSHIIVDSIGKLLKLYANADIAYIGGAFGSGIHSVSEPAGYGIPIISGPDIYKMPDAVTLNKLNSLKTISNSNELNEILTQLINDLELRQRIGLINQNYIKNNSGSSIKIAEYILKNNNWNFYESNRTHTRKI